MAITAPAIRAREEVMRVAPLSGTLGTPVSPPAPPVFEGVAMGVIVAFLEGAWVGMMGLATVVVVSSRVVAGLVTLARVVASSVETAEVTTADLVAVADLVTEGAA
jgi:hypothetical protein